MANIACLRNGRIVYAISKGAFDANKGKDHKILIIGPLKEQKFFFPQGG